MSKKTLVLISLILLLGAAFGSAELILVANGELEAARVASIIITGVSAMIMLGISASQLYVIDVRERYFQARKAEADMLHASMVAELDRMQTIRERWVQDNRRPWQMP